MKDFDFYEGFQFLWRISISMKDFNFCEGFQFLGRISIPVKDLELVKDFETCEGFQFLWRILEWVKDFRMGEGFWNIFFGFSLIYAIFRNHQKDVPFGGILSYIRNFPKSLKRRSIFWETLSIYGKKQTNQNDVQFRFEGFSLYIRKKAKQSKWRSI